MTKRRIMHKSGVQYPSLVGEGDLSKAESIALKYIQLFDQKLQEEGIRSLIGTEQEMFIQPEADKTFTQIAEENNETLYNDLNRSSASHAFVNHMENAITAVYAPFIAAENARRLEAWEKRKATALAQSTPEPPPPNLINRPSDIIEKFEYTARGNPGRMEIVNRPLSPARAARCHAANIRALYQASEEGQEELKKIDAEPAKTVRTLVEQGPKMARIRFVPVGAAANPKYATMYSQHLNISQHIRKEHYGEAVDEKTPLEGRANLMALPGYSIALDRVLQAFTDKDMLVLMANPHSYSRLSRAWLEDGHHIDRLKYHTTNMHREGQMRSRVEFRVPDTSSNPYLSILLLMAASYYTANMLARLGGESDLPFAERVANGARKYEAYHLHCSKDLTPQELNDIRTLLLGTVLSENQQNSEFARQSYQAMITSFSQHSLLLPMMGEVGSDGDALCLKESIIKQAKRNFRDPQKPKIKDYYDPIKKPFDPFREPKRSR